MANMLVWCSVRQKKEGRIRCDALRRRQRACTMQLACNQKRLGPWVFFVCVMGVELIQILAIDMYAPALPTMSEAFGVTALYLNNPVFSFLFASPIATVLAGPISDRFGRKPVFLAGCILFTLGSLLCAMAPSVEVLVLARAIEALGCGCSMTLAAAIVQDAYKGEDLKLAMTLLQSLVIAGPVLAPFMGSFAVEHVGWRGIFWGLAAGGLATVVMASLISETYDAKPNAGKKLGDTLLVMGRGAKTLLSDRSFTALALFIGVTGIPFFAFIAVSSYILLDSFHMSYLGYSFIYAGACLTNMMAPFVYMRLSRTWLTAKIMRFVIVLMIASAVLFALVGSLDPLLFLLAFAPYALAEGIARPAAYLVLLDQPSEIVGTASAIGNFAYGVITAFATIAATLPWPSFVIGLAVLVLASALGSTVLYMVGRGGWTAK